VLGVVEASGDAVPVSSPFTGWMMGMLAVEGERVREGQPICWLRAL
jgi:biotin carboxyl carrier protein